MRKTAFIKALALFISYIVILLPINASFVLAGIGIVQVKGSAGIQNYAKENDYVDFSVTATVAGDSDISASQLKLSPIPVPFQSCSPSLSGFSCALRYPNTGTLNFGPGEVPYTIKLYRDDGSEEDSFSANLSIDNLAPGMIFNTAPPSAAGLLKLEYTATDYAYIQGDASKCTGISKVEFYKTDFSGSPAASKQHSTTSCNVTGNVEFSSGITSGILKVCTKAYDMLNQSSSQCINLNIDSIKPVITKMEILDPAGLPINYMGNTPIDALLVVEIKEDNLNEPGVKANLSELTVITGSDNKAADSCLNINGTNSCFWSFILNPITTEKTFSIRITAADDTGNTDVKTFPKTIGIDNVGPYVEKIRSVKEDQLGRSYLKADNNKIIAQITEAQAGLSPQRVLLHIGSATYTAANCSQGWTCFWEGVSTSLTSGTETVWLDTDSTDRIGNPFSAKFETKFVVDTIKPEIVSVNVVPLGGEEAAHQVAVMGNSLKVTAIVSDNIGFISGTADFSKFIAGAKSVSAESCTDKGNGQSECVWTTEPIDRKGFFQDTATLFITDIAGNSLVYNLPITVYEEADISGDFFKHTAQCMPNKIDRETTTLINQRVYCSVALKSNPIIPLEVTLDGCTGEDAGKVESAELINNIGSNNPFIVIRLAADPMEIDQLDVDCKLNVYFRSETRVSRIPEIEIVKVGIPLYNMPLGKLDAELEEKIEEAKDFSFIIGDWVETFNTIFFYAERICELFNTILKIMGVLQIVGLEISLAEQAVPAGAPFMEQARIGVQNANSGLQAVGKDSWVQIINKFCKFISCRLFFDDVWGTEGEGGDGFGDKLGNWQRGVLDTANTVATLGTDKIPLLNWVMQDKKAYSYTDTGYEVHMTGKLNPKDSIVLSTLTLCIPGIIYHLNKLRQMECMYVDCLETNARNGLPLKACEDAKHYAQCKYFWGEIFQLAPITGLWNAMINLIKTALSSPFGFVDLVLGYICRPFIEKPYSGVEGYVCLVNDIAGLVADIYEDFAGLGESWTIQGNYCERVDWPDEDEDEDEDEKKDKKK